MPRKKTEILPLDIPEGSPWVVEELAQYFGHKYCKVLTALPDPARLPELNARWTQIYVLHKFVKKEIHSEHKLPSTPRRDKAYLNAASTMYIRAFGMLTKGFSLGLFSADYKSSYLGEPLLAWGALLFEGLLLGSCKEVRTKTDFVKFLQSTNRTMGNLDGGSLNPFPDYSHTNVFLAEARAAASYSDRFNKEHFRLFAADRQKMAQVIRKSGALILEDGTIVDRKTRYKMPPQKNVPTQTLAG